MNAFVRLCLLLVVCVSAIAAIKCYKGFKYISGQSFGDQVEECEDSGAYCYNMTAEAAILLNVVKAGCSKYRCMLSRNRCVGSTFQGVPVSFCCCNDDLCNSRN
ncbi:hypothetical protein L596_008564 [Steinernema carpocapsae]|uniref:Uncharacterized protein n=1 Tax=Steinernema carpocapsae TaxID=34508 RepID=A0A4U5PDD5_STECR|nr:hypothetical protein L596_008564 [Steinernema carpocapsae]